MRRTNAQINTIYKNFLAIRDDFDTVASLSKSLDISQSVVRKWVDGNTPLPDANPKPKNFYNNRNANGYLGNVEDRQALADAEDAFDAEILGMTVEEFRAIYASGMEKIQLMINNDSTFGSTLREYLDQPEKEVMDTTQF